MALSKTALRKMRRYERERYFRYLDRLVDSGRVASLIQEVRANIKSQGWVSIYEYILDRRNSEQRRACADAVLSIWENEVKSLIPRWGKWSVSTWKEFAAVWA